MKHRTRLAVAAVLLLAAGPGAAGDLARDQAEGTGYAPQTGTWFEAYEEYWKEIHAAAFIPCIRGTGQSPILLSSAAASAAGTLTLTDSGRFFLGTDSNQNGHTFQFTLQHPGGAADANTLIHGSRVFQAAQFHFHHPSEHLLDGRRYPMEMHIVHRSHPHPSAMTAANAGDNIAVVAVFLNVGPPARMVYEWLPPLFAKYDVNKHTVRHSDFPNSGFYDEMLPLPASRQYLHYKGSLTTPHCGGGVSWYVMKTPVVVSQEFVDKFRAGFPMNARWPQNLDGRSVAAGE